jgi:hypothetical protein
LPRPNSDFYGEVFGNSDEDFDGYDRENDESIDGDIERGIRREQFSLDWKEPRINQSAPIPAPRKRGRPRKNDPDAASDADSGRTLRKRPKATDGVPERSASQVRHNVGPIGRLGLEAIRFEGYIDSIAHQPSGNARIVLVVGHEWLDDIIFLPKLNGYTFGIQIIDV